MSGGVMSGEGKAAEGCDVQGVIVTEGNSSSLVQARISL